jgi:cholesterol transport system auxiliary component
LAIQLAACAGSGRNRTPAAVYDLGLPVAGLADGESRAKLALEVKAAPWLEGRNIAYRLAYDDPLRLREYAESRWASSPASLLAQLLRQQLGVFSANSNTAADCLIRFDLQEFSQVFATPQQSRALLHAKASLVDAKHRLIAEQVFAIERPAATQDARGGVSALQGASEEAGRQLADWLQGLEKRQALSRCRSA